jgi:phosphoribosylanthranilate isomerase
MTSYTTPVPAIKLCGFTRQLDIDVAMALAVDYVGFVFYEPSPRYIDPYHARVLIDSLSLSPRTVPVGLFVNHNEVFVRDAVAASGVKLLQFHGNESPDFCEALSQDLSLPYWKALHVAPDSTSDSLLKLCQAYHSASAILFDTAIPTQANVLNEPIWGGTGHTFEWKLLTQLARQSQIGNVPALILSGGLSAHNVAQGIQLLQPWAVDVSSSIEALDALSGKPLKGIKDAAIMTAFVRSVRGIPSRS